MLWHGLTSKVVIPAVLSPVIAGLVAAVGTWLLYRITRSLTQAARGHGFRIGQIGPACLVSLAHGTNDAQKTMGVITLALIANGTLAKGSNATRRRSNPACSSVRESADNATPPALNRIIEWLRAGSPEGVPEHDYIPLFALLGSQLTNEEVSLIATELEASTDPESAEAIKKAIVEVTNTTPNDADVNRVRSRLAAGGWPLARPEHTD